MLECAHLTRREAIYSKKLTALAHQSHTMNPQPKAPTSAIDTDLLDALDAALLRLRDRDREILMLRHVQGLSYREIATTLGKSEAATQRQASRALEALATRLRIRYAALTGVAVGTHLSHGLALPATPVAVAALSATARKLAAASGSTGMASLWFASLSRGKSLLAGATVMTVIGVGVYLWLKSSPQSQSIANPALLPDVKSQRGTSSGNAQAEAATAALKGEQPLTDEERDRLLAAERVMMTQALKQLYQVHQALFAYASGHEQQFPNPKDRNANAALRELFRVGMMDDEKLFCLGGTSCKTDGNIGSKADDYAKALGPNENSISYVAGLASDRDDSTLPILRADYVGKSGLHYVVVARIGGATRVYETTDGIVLDKRNGTECDIFSKAYGTVPENILSPVMTDAAADDEWEEVLNLAARDPDAARERCLQPLAGRDPAPWFTNAVPIVFGNIPLEQFEATLEKVQTIGNERQRVVLRKALASNFSSYYTVDRQGWPRVDQLFQVLCQTDEIWYEDPKAIVDSRLKQESASQTAAWLDGLPPVGVTNLIGPVISKFAAEDPQAAADWYLKIHRRLPSAAATDRILEQAVALWQEKAGSGEADLAAASEWLLQQDQAKADRAKGTLAKKWFQVGEPEVATQWAESILDQKYRASVLQALQGIKPSPKPLQPD